MELQQRIEMVEELIAQFREGAEIEQVKREAKAVFAGMSGAEARAVEDAMQSNRQAVDDMWRLHQLHLDNLRQELDSFRASLPSGHPLLTMIEEHDQILDTLAALERLNGKVESMTSLPAELARQLRSIAENLLAAEPHHAREEEVVFAELAAAGIDKTVAAMNAEHEELRAKKHELLSLAQQAADMEFGNFRRELEELSSFLVFALGDHIAKENHIMYPAAMRMIRGEDRWAELKRRCDAVGYCNFHTLH